MNHSAFGKGFPLGGRLLFVLILIWLVLPITPVQADLGPKPTMTFTFDWQIPVQPVISGTLLICEDANCTVSTPLGHAGPQYFTCDDTGCRSMAYGYGDYMRLVIQFADGERMSNIFGKAAFDAVYTVTITQDSLFVQETAASILAGSTDSQGTCCCCPGLLPTVVLELLAAAVYAGVAHLPRMVAGLAPLASLITLPFVWFVFPLLPVSDAFSTGLAETFAVLAEAGIIFICFRRILPLRQAVLLSLVMNAVSFVIGLILF